MSEGSNTVVRMVSEGSDTVDLKSKETHVIHKEGSRVRQEDTIPPKVYDNISTLLDRTL